MTRKLSSAAILTALAVVSLYGAVTLPTGRIAFLAIASLCILVAVAECGVRYAVIAYVATANIAALFMPFKLQIILFIVFLGYYPIVKCYIERLDNLKLEWLVKILFFSAILIIAYFVLQYALLPRIEFGAAFQYVFSNLPFAVVVLEIVFIVYDYILSLLASYYLNVVQKRIRKKG